MQSLPTEPAAPLSSDPVAATSAPPKILATDDVRPADPAAEEAARVAAYDANYVWQGVELLPFTPGRERLWERLCAGDVPLPVEVDPSRLAPYASHAVKLLYLCSHEPEVFRLLRADTGRFIEVIEEWGDENVPRELNVEAVTLALKIINDARRTIAVPKPSGRADSGN